METNFIAGIICFFISNLITSYIASLLFTGEKSENNLAISNKQWKTFLIVFIGYSILFIILVLNK